MPASYPSSIFAFTNVNNGDTSDASQIDNPVAEIIAVETALLNGFQHALKPLTDNTNDLGDSSHAWKNLWTKGTVQLNGVTYTFPASDGTAGQPLRTNGSKVLSWAFGASANSTSIVQKTTASASAVMLGYAQALTPSVTGRVLILFNGYAVSNNASLFNATAQANYGTGTAPTNGAAVTGTQASPSLSVTTDSATFVPISLSAFVTGLTIGTAYWFDIAGSQAGGATLTLSGTFTLVEL